MPDDDYSSRSLIVHEQLRGKIGIHSKMPLKSRDDLSVAAIAGLLRCVGHDPAVCRPVKDVIVCDSKGAIHRGRTDLNDRKRELAYSPMRVIARGRFGRCWKGLTSLSASAKATCSPPKISRA